MDSTGRTDKRCGSFALRGPAAAVTLDRQAVTLIKAILPRIKPLSFLFCMRKETPAKKADSAFTPRPGTPPCGDFALKIREFKYAVSGQ